MNQQLQDLINHFKSTGATSMHFDRIENSSDVDYENDMILILQAIKNGDYHSDLGCGDSYNSYYTKMKNYQI